MHRWGAWVMVCEPRLAVRSKLGLFWRVLTFSFGH
jgi:hypothetical protein